MEPQPESRPSLSTRWKARIARERSERWWFVAFFIVLLGVFGAHAIFFELAWPRIWSGVFPPPGDTAEVKYRWNGYVETKFERTGNYTSYDSRGRVSYQQRRFDDHGAVIEGGEIKRSPPWWWNAQDQGLARHLVSHTLPYGGSYAALLAAVFWLRRRWNKGREHVGCDEVSARHGR